MFKGKVYYRGKPIPTLLYFKISQKWRQKGNFFCLQYFEAFIWVSYTKCRARQRRLNKNVDCTKF